MRYVGVVTVVGALVLLCARVSALPKEPDCPGRVAAPARFTDAFARFVHEHTFPARRIVHRMVENRRPTHFPRTEPEWESAYRAVGLEKEMTARLDVIRALAPRLYGNAPPHVDGLTIVRWLAERLFVIPSFTWRGTFLPYTRRIALTTSPFTRDAFPGGWPDFAAHAAELANPLDSQWMRMETLEEDKESVDSLLASIEDIYATAVEIDGREEDLTESLFIYFKMAAEQATILSRRLALEQQLFGDIAVQRRQALHADVRRVMRRLVAIIDDRPEADRWQRYVASRLEGSLRQLDSALAAQP